MERKQKILVIVLVACLAVSLFFNAYQYFNGCNEKSASYSFVWQKNYIRSGLVRMEVTFDWSTDDLKMIVEVNDNDSDSYGADYIGLVFDTNRNEDLYDELGFVLYAANMVPYKPRANKLEDWGGLRTSEIEMPPIPSPYHTCTFNNETGYVFHIAISKENINFERHMLMHLCFFDRDAWWGSPPRSTYELNVQSVVWVQFEV